MAYRYVRLLTLTVLGTFALSVVGGRPSRTAGSDLRDAIRVVLAASASPPLIQRERDSLGRLYDLTDDAAVWLTADGRLVPAATDALHLLTRADEDGLELVDYDVEGLFQLQHAANGARPALTVLARFDVTLSAAVLRYLRHVHSGRVDPRGLGFRIASPQELDDLPVRLRFAIAAGRLAELAGELRPPFVQYALLRSALIQYRLLEADTRLEAPPPLERPVHPGDLYEAISVVERELTAFGDLPAEAYGSSGARYEAPMVDGVKRFQVRHGLEPDGVLGRATIDALRVPLTSRVRQIELALERLRWLPRFDGERIIALNIPMFRLWAWDRPTDAVPRFGMDVIVGRAPRTETPGFISELREVIVRPYWNVPPSILRHEVLPQIERDPDYLSREDMEIVLGAGDEATRVERNDESLDALRHGALRVRQRPGPMNALGLIAFAFPNDFNVYMHGTPAPALFTKSRRDFSHGCVRVADPLTLAEWVLADQSDWTRDRIMAATDGNMTIHVKVTRSIRVVLFYTTAVVSPDDGALHFAEDIYQYDAQLDRALIAQSLIPSP